MAWPRALKPHEYVVVQQADFEEHAEDVISPCIDLSDVRRLQSWRTDGLLLRLTSCLLGRPCRCNLRGH
ncbi:hypothetical protein L798_09053 [Zootermopsis nevadensis]|uniref:Uncharacterized protein n=1 Tax=Zootermopsis nevadensis TaxID=136037 RepID=A0A067QGV6_ZOONE|nr:hypothetical protein L798_09053 [Zootermopsis nevadensis]